MVILIDNDDLLVLKAAKNIKRLEYWADILIPDHDFRICGTERKAFSVYTELELRMLIRNTMNVEIQNGTDYNRMLQLISEHCETMPEDLAPVVELKQALGREVQPPAIIPAKEKSKPRSRDKPPAGVSRPKAGTTTGRVWDACDSLVSQAGDIPAKAEVLALLPDVNPNTVATQYSKWKRASK